MIVSFLCFPLDPFIAASEDSGTEYESANEQSFSGTLSSHRTYILAAGYRICNIPWYRTYVMDPDPSIGKQKMLKPLCTF
jgi:hypothetical protein